MSVLKIVCSNTLLSGMMSSYITCHAVTFANMPRIRYMLRSTHCDWRSMETYTRIDQYDTTFVNHLKLNIILTSANPSASTRIVSLPEIRKSYSRLRSRSRRPLRQSVRLALRSTCKLHARDARSRCD